MRREYDVFLTYTARDSGIARKVLRKLEMNQLNVFHCADVRAGDDWDKTLWNALAESAALVVVTIKRVEAASILAEIGAAAAWQKPIYIVTNRAKHVDVGLRSHHVRFFALERLPALIKSLRTASRPMTTRERLLLARIYSRLKIPTDQITRSPVALDRLTAQFNRHTGKNVSGNVLVRELLQMRKRGRLPALRPVRSKTHQSLHVVPRQEGWAVAAAGKRIVSIHRTQEAAIEAARDFAIRHVSDVIIHRPDGKILAKDSYGRDPTPPRDRNRR